MSCCCGCHEPSAGVWSGAVCMRWYKQQTTNRSTISTHTASTNYNDTYGYHHSHVHCKQANSPTNQQPNKPANRTNLFVSVAQHVVAAARHQGVNRMHDHLCAGKFMRACFVFVTGRTECRTSAQADRMLQALSTHTTCTTSTLQLHTPSFCDFRLLMCSFNTQTCSWLKR